MTLAQSDNPVSSRPYDIISMLLHWVMAFIIVYLIFFSEFEELDDAVMTDNIQLHSGLGLMILLLAAVRWLWRQTHPRPDFPGIAWQTRLRKYVYLIFYGCFFLSPLTGIILAGLVSYPVSVFGITEISGWLQDGETMAKLMNSVHGFCADVMLALLLIHIAAVLYHHFFKRDGLLWVMLPLGTHK